MLEDRIIVQDRGIDAGLAALMQNANKGMDPAALMAMMNNNGGFGGNGGWWWIWIILIWFCWGGNGFGAGTSATLPILIGTNGDTRPLVTYNNEPVRVENLAGTGIYLLHYNKYTNQVFLVSDGYKATATPSA